MGRVEGGVASGRRGGVWTRRGLKVGAWPRRGGVASHAALCLCSVRRRFRVNSAGGGCPPHPLPHPQARPSHGRPRRVPAQPSASFRRRRSSASGTRTRYDERPQSVSGFRGRPGIPPDGTFGSTVPGEGGREGGCVFFGRLLRTLRWRRGGFRSLLGPEEAALLPERGARGGGGGVSRAPSWGGGSPPPPTPRIKKLLTKRSALWPLLGVLLQPGHCRVQESRGCSTAVPVRLRRWRGAGGLRGKEQGWGEAM